MDQQLVVIVNKFQPNEIAGNKMSREGVEGRTGILGI